MRRTVLIIVVCVIFGLVTGIFGWRTWRLSAQNPDAYIVRVYVMGDVSSYQVFTFPASDVMCNVTPYMGALPVQDPIKLEWVDREHPGMVCVWQAFNTIMPEPGNYEVTLSTVTRGKTSAESAHAPFVVTRTSTLDTPVGVKVYR